MTTTNDLAVGTSLGSITFDANAGQFILNGNRIAIGSAGITNNSGVLQTVALPLTLGAATTFNSGSNGLTLSGIIDGAGGISKTGAGTLTLSAANTYSGLTTISAGTLALSGAGVIAGAVDLSVSGASLSISAVTPAGSSLSALSGVAGTSVALGGKALTVGAANTSTSFAGVISGTGGSLVKTGTGTLTLSGVNTYTGLTTISGGTLALSGAGVIPGAVNLSASGATLDLSAVTPAGLSLSEISAVAGSTVALGGKSLTLGSANTSTTFAGVISGTGGSLIKAGTGTLTLSGANTYTGATSIRGGTLTLSGSGNLGSGSNVTVWADGNSGVTAALNLNNLNATIGSLTLGGTGDIGGPKTNTVTTGTGTLTLGGNLTFANGTATNQGSIAGNLALGANRTIEVGSNYTAESGTSSAVISAAISGTGFGITKTGDGVLTLSGSNTYTGSTTLQAGTLFLNSANALGGNGSIAFTGGTLRYSANNTADLSGRLSLGSGTLRVDTNGQNVTWASAIGSGQTGGLTKSGTGTLTLGGSNAYTGTTTLSAGTLALGSDSAIGSGTLVLAGGILTPTGAARSLSNGMNLDGTSSLDGGSLGLALSGNLTSPDVAGAGISNHGILTLTGSANSSLTGTLSQGTNNPYDLAKAGTGTWTISGNNTFLGQTTLSAGALRLTHANALGIRSGADTLLLSGGNLQLAADSATTFGPASGYGTTLTSNATITLDRLTSGAGLAHQIGGLTMGAQTLTLEKGANISSGTAKLIVGGASIFTANPTFNLGSGTELHFGSNMTGAVNLTKNGAGILTMGVGSGLADVTVNAGQLNINWFQGLGTAAGTLSLASGVTLDNTSSAALSVANPKSISLGASGGSGTFTFLGTQSLGMGSGTVTLSGNTTFNVAANTLTFGGDVTGAFGITKTGAGTLEFAGLSGSGSYSGNTQIDAGTLFLSGASRFATGTTITVNTGGTLRVGPSATTEGATVVINGGSQTIEGIIDANLSFASNSTLDTGSAAYNGTVTIQTGVTATTASDLLGTVPASPTASRIVIESGATLAGTSTFTINQRKGIQLGTLTGTAAGSASFSPGAGTQIFLPSSIIGDAALVKTGAGNIRLIGDNSYRGGTVINQGIIGFFDDASLGLAGTSVTLNGGIIVAASPDASRTDSENRTATIGSSRSVILGAGTTNSMDAQTERVLVYDGVIAESSGVANMEFGLAGTRNGIVRLGGLNTYSGTTTVEAGVVEITHFGNGGVASGIGDSSSAAGNLVLGGPTAGGTLRYTGGSPASSDRLFTLGIGGGILDGGSQGITLTGTGSIGLNGTSARSLTLAGTGNSSLAAVISDAAAGATSLVKSGSGTWTLSGTNTHTGDTTLAGGVLAISSAANLGSSVNPGGVVFNGGTLRATQALTLNRDVILTGAGTLDPGANAVTASGAFSGGGAFTKEGAGVLTLTNTNNSFAGGITVAAGTLKAVGSGALGLTAGAGPISLAAGSTLEINGTGANAGASGNIFNTISGEGGLTRSYSEGGTIIGISLAGTESNTFTGLTEVVSGTLRLEKNDGLGSGGSNANARALGGNVSISGTGTLILRQNEQLPSNAVVTMTAGTLEYPATGVTGFTETFGSLVKSGTASFNTNGNTVNIGSLDLSGNGNTGVTASGGVAGTLNLGALTFSGTGADPTISIASVASGNANRLVLDGNVIVNASGGTARIDSSGGGAVAGELSLGGSNRTFTVASGSSLAISAAISNGGLILDGAGIVSLSGINTYAGGTVINAGTLSIDSADAIGTGKITFSGGMLEANNTMTLSNALEVNTSSEGVSVGTGKTLTLSGEITGSSTLRKEGPGILVLSGSNSAPTLVEEGTLQGSNSSAGSSLSLAENSTFVFNQSEAGTLEQNTYGGNISGAGIIDVNGPLVLAGANDSFSGKVRVGNNANLVLPSNANIGGNAEIILQGSSLSQSVLTFTPANAQAFNNPITVSSNIGVLSNNGSAPVTLSGNIVKDGSVLTFTGTNAFVITGSIGGSSANSDLLVTGNTVTLEAANTYNGPTFIRNGGTLNANAANALPIENGRTALVMDDEGTGSSTLSLGVSQSAASLTGASTSSVNLGANTLTIGIAVGNSTFAGGISGTGSLVKDGASTQILSGSNTFTGGVTISEGTLQIGAGGTTGSLAPASAIVNNAALAFQRSDTITQGTDFASTISGSGSLTQAGSGTLVLNGANTFTGGVTITAGTLQIGAGGTTGSLATGSAIVNNAALAFQRSNTITQGTDFASTISGSGSLTQAGGGTLVLNGANTYSGGTTVSSGTLLVNNTTGSGTGTGAVTVASGATLGGSGIISGDVTISGTHSPGNSPGIQTITGNASYTSTSIFDWELISNTNDPLLRGTEYDGVNVTGNLTVDPDAVFNIVLNLAGSTVDFANAFWLEKRSWVVFDVDGTIASTFQNFTISLDSIGNSYNPAAGSFSMTGGTLEWNPIPEPSSALVGLLLGGLILRRRRQPTHPR